MPAKPGALIAADLEELLPHLAVISDLFQTAQLSLATHRKSLNQLHAIFLVSITVVEEMGDSIGLVGERAFGKELRECLIRIMAVKKGVDVGEKGIKFVAAFIKFAIDYDGENPTEEEDGPASRLVASILTFLLKGFTAKNKIPRYRSVQLVALLISNLGEIDDETYQDLKAGLILRAADKEPTVRNQAVVALSKLQAADSSDAPSTASGSESDNDRYKIKGKKSRGGDESDDDDTAAELAAKRKRNKKKAKKAEEDGEPSVRDVLIDLTQFDPVAEVRRVALFNLLPNPVTLPYLLDRTTDVDSINRRAIYTQILLDIPFNALGSDARIVLERGLGEREEGVKKAVKGCIAKWCENDLEAFIEQFDILEDVEILEQVFEAVYETREDLIENIDFGEELFMDLRPYTAILARTYFNHLRRIENPLLADLEPVLSVLGNYIAAEWEGLVPYLKEPGTEEDDEEDEMVEERTFNIRELIRLALEGDFADEIGRRRVFELMREMLSHPFLPTSLISTTLDVLRKGTEERDFLRIVVEIVQMLRDASIVSDDDESETEEGGETLAVRKAKKVAQRNSMLGEAELGKRRELDLRCLWITRALLERVMGTLNDNSALHGIVHELIVPSVRSKDEKIRGIGLMCLGLCSLLDKKMAKDSFPMLARESQAGTGELRVKVLETIFDLLILWGVDFVEELGFDSTMLTAFLLDMLEQEEPESGTAAVVGMSKLLLGKLIVDAEILNRLVLLYFASETSENPQLRQCLSYFFPAYCYSSSVNQRRFSEVFTTALGLLSGVYNDLTDKSVMVAPLQIGLQLIDWTDPQKSHAINGKVVDETIQFDLAVQMMKDVYTSELKEDRKLMCQLVTKLFISEEVEELKVKALLVLITSIKENRPLVDALSKNALVRFETSLMKTFGERIAELTEEEIDNSKHVKRMDKFLRMADGYDEETEEEEEEEIEEVTKEAGRLSLGAESVTADEVEAEEQEQEQEQAEPEEEEEEEEEE